MKPQRGAFKLNPFFLPSDQGGLFSICYQPTNPSGQALLIAPPFAEELNRSRSGLSLLAQQLAARGVIVLLVDLYGTGDSQGEFSEATWAIWQQNLRSGYHWLHAQGEENIALLALRFGALLAPTLCNHPSLNLNPVYLWQPELQGSKLIKQFLRQKASSEMIATGGKMSIKPYEKQLMSGNAVESAGYTLSPSLYSDLINQQLDSSSFDAVSSLIWLDVVDELNNPLPMSRQKILDYYRSCEHLSFEYHKIQGEPFWQQYECSPNTTLINKTADYFE